MKKLPGSYTEVNAYFVSFDSWKLFQRVVTVHV